MSCLSLTALCRSAVRGRCGCEKAGIMRSRDVRLGSKGRAKAKRCGLVEGPDTPTRRAPNALFGAARAGRPTCVVEPFDTAVVLTRGDFARRAVLPTASCARRDLRRSRHGWRGSTGHPRRTRLHRPSTWIPLNCLHGPPPIDRDAIVPGSSQPRIRSRRNSSRSVWRIDAIRPITADQRADNDRGGTASVYELNRSSRSTGAVAARRTDVSCAHSRCD
jgi:hypothetical protein